MKSEVFNIDCMLGMKQYSDKYFDLAVVDPPYGIGADKKNAHSSIRDNDSYKDADWDLYAPTKEYFIELFRVSKEQIIWGGNYFLNYLHSTKCFLIWNKPERNFSLADAEIAWASFDKSIRCFDYPRNNGDRIHPTQKPIKLYSWIYKNYLPEGGKVLDTHLGSGSNRIAADKAGNIDFTGYELDKDYYEAQEKRWENYKAQLTMF